MIVTAPCSFEQELLIEQHLLDGKPLFVAPNERFKLLAWVQQHHPGYKISSAEIDLENAVWKLNTTSVTVST